MLTKDQKDQDNQSDSKNPGQNYWDSKINGLEGSFNGKDAEYPNGHPSKKDGLADIEQMAEGATTKPAAKDAASEYGFYRGFGDDNDLGRMQKLINSFKGASTYKKGAGVGGVAAIILLIVGFFMFISTFQLVHIAESLSGIFDAQTHRVLNKRAAVHYSIALDEDGKSYYNKTNKKVTGRLGKGYASLDPAALREDLKSKGYTIEVDSQTGKFKINGQVIDGKLSSQRSQLTDILDESYPQDNFVKRYMRSKTAFKSMGIQRVFFFENTKRKYATWELEMISRLRQRVSGDNLDARVGTAGTEEGQNQTDEITQQANELSTDLEDPSFSPDPIEPPDPPAGITDFDINKIGNAAGDAAGKTIALDGIGQSACNIKYYLKGVEYGAGAIRHRALIAHAGTFMVAAHQLKTGEGVSEAQMSALMTILNRKPGIGASGSYQLLNGNKNAKVKHTDTLAVSFAGTEGVGGKLNEVNSMVDQVFGFIQDEAGVPVKDYCKLTRNVAYQITSGVVGVGYIIISVIGTPFTGGGSLAVLVGKTALTGALSLGLSYLTQVAQPYLIQALAGGDAIFNYGENQGGDELMDGIVGGKMAMANGERYQAGMTQSLTAPEVAELENTIALEKTEKLQSESVYQKYLALDNVDSTLSKNLATMPSTPQSMATTIASGLTSLPTKFANAVSLFTPQGSAKAADAVVGNPYVTANPLGLPQYGMADVTVEKINKDFDPIENENWIYENGGIEQYIEWRNLCYPTDDPSMLFGFAIDEDKEEALKEKCTNIQDERYLRYATYHLDRGIQQGILFMSKLSDCTDPDSEDINCDDTTQANQPITPSTDPSTCVTTGVPAPPEDYTRVTYKGKTFNKRTVAMLKVAEDFYGKDYIVAQGSYNAGGVSQSAGTHDGGGAIDISASGMSSAERIAMVTALRKAGFAAWLRTPSQGDWGYHIHAIAIGDKEASAGAQSQVKDYFNGKNGLSGGAADTHPKIGRPIPEWATKYGSALCPR